MKNKKGAKWQVYHLVQPYFFAHHHFHKRKIDVLVENGVDAKLLSVVPKKTYIKYQDKYDEILKLGYFKLIIVPSVKLAPFYLFIFLINNFVKKKRVVLHILRSSPWAAVLIKFLPFIKRKFLYLQEFEGDTYSEFIYVKEYCEFPRPSEKATSLKNKIKASILLGLEILQVKKADGLVLMSKEHVDLWESRLQKPLPTTILPTVADPKLVWFDALARIEIRDSFKINNSLVLAYTGNVICHWQRREEMCRLVAGLQKRGLSIQFMAIVRSDDLLLMDETLKKYEIENITTLLSVKHNEVYKYLSAADLALFLRHNHTMNKVVTSGKLGEYLSAGLPVLTTGSNANVLNKFIKDANAGYFIDDSLKINNKLIVYLQEIYSKKDDLKRRNKICKLTHEKFGDTENPFYEYARFIKSIIVD